MKKSYQVLLGATIVYIMSMNQVSAAIPQEFSLEEVSVTALRNEAKELKTPAYVHVIQGEELKKIGSDNLLDALKFTEGITYDGYGAPGHLYSTMTAKATIRGMDRGTLVLINGVPINMSGVYALERIPVDNIERVEVVKGSGSVLYGSSALGGVINIITKAKLENSASIEFGSFGKKAQDLSLQLGKLNFYGSHKETGDLGAVSNPYSGKYTAYRGDEKNTVRWSYDFNDKIKFTHQFEKDDFKVDRLKVGEILDEKIFQEEEKNYYALDVAHGVWKSKIYNNTLSREYNKFSNKGINTDDTTTEFANLGLDTQTSLDTKLGKVTTGLSWQRETLEFDSRKDNNKDVSKKERDAYALFMQLNHELSPKQDLVIGLRQDFVDQKDGKTKDYNEFNPQIQLNTLIDSNTSWYINMGRAFNMPKMTDLYTSSAHKEANFDLKPEYGYNYEVGVKRIENSHAIKFAIYHMDFTDYIRWAKNPSTSKYEAYNTKFRNTGAEVSYEKNLNDSLSYAVGVNYGNPEEYSIKPGTIASWQQTFPRLQLTSRISYNYENWSANLAASYYTMRAKDRKPSLPVNLTVGYKVDDNQSLQLRVENLLDRNDIVSHDSAEYLALERSYALKYTYKF